MSKKVAISQYAGPDMVDLRDLVDLMISSKYKLVDDKKIICKVDKIPALDGVKLKWNKARLVITQIDVDGEPRLAGVYERKGDGDWWHSGWHFAIRQCSVDTLLSIVAQ